MLFIMICLKSYPKLILDFLTTNGIFGFDFIAPIVGISSAHNKDTTQFDIDERIKNHPAFITPFFY